VPVKVCFYAAGSIPIHARSLEERPLGGTETGLIRVAEILRERGHEVFVVTSHPNPEQFNAKEGPFYIREEILRRVVPVDVLVAVQFWRPLFIGIPARRTFFWTGDGYEQFSNWGIGDRRVSSRIEKLFAASTWHARTLVERASFPAERIAVIGNGVHPPYFQGVERRHPHRLIYTSAPYRGLELAAKYFQILRKDIPDLEFHIFAGLSIYDRDTPFQGPHAENFAVLAKALSQIPGIVLRGNVKQQELAREYMRSALMLYPNIIEETCCITALEAQAAGCPVIASAISALPETVGDGGVVISGEPGSKEYSEALLQAAAKILLRPEVHADLSRRAQERVQRNFTWQHVALRMESAFQ